MSDFDPRRQPFRQWLGHRRRARGYTQVELAAKVGCSVFTIGRIEEGARRPSRKLAERLVDALGVPDDQRASLVQLARERPDDAHPSIGANYTGLPRGKPRRDGEQQVAAAGAGEDERSKAHPAIRVRSALIEDSDVVALLISLSPGSDAVLLASAIARLLATGELPNGPLRERLRASLASGDKGQALSALDPGDFEN